MVGRSGRVQATGPDQEWRNLGMTRFTVNTEFTSSRHRARTTRTLAEHIALLGQYRDAIGGL
jgi:hypothetical protein